MNIEKSIKLMKVIKEILPEHYNFDFGKEEIDEIIRRLQMWEEFKEKCKKGNLYIDVSRGLSAGCSVKDEMEVFEKEYLPKSKEEKEKEMDKWFVNLSVNKLADIACNFWDGASYEEKKEEYELE